MKKQNTETVRKIRWEIDASPYLSVSEEIVRAAETAARAAGEAVSRFADVTRTARESGIAPDVTRPVDGRDGENARRIEADGGRSTSMSDPNRKPDDAADRGRPAVMPDPNRGAGDAGRVGDGYDRELLRIQLFYNRKSELARRNAEFETFLEGEKDETIRKLDHDLRESTLKTATANLEELSRRHREFMAAYKAMAIAQGMMDTYNAANAAFKGAVGAFPPPLGIILGSTFAAIAVAAGLANVERIAAQKFAGGTGFAPGGPSLVGENGPELVNLPRGSQVFTATQTKNIYDNSMRSLTVHLHDHSGSVVDTLTMDVRSGRADRLISTIMDRLG